MCFFQHYLIGETLVSYLDVRRRVRYSLKHVYLADRHKGARSMDPAKRKCIIIIIFIIIINRSSSISFSF